MSPIPPYENKALLQKISEGDEKAFEILFNGFLPEIYPIAFRMLKSDAAVKDIVQDIFIRLWIGRARLTEIEQPRNYIFRMVYNQSLKCLQKEKQKQELSGEEEIVDDALTPDLLLNVSQIRYYVEEAVLLLAPKSLQKVKKKLFDAILIEWIASCAFTFKVSEVKIV